MWFTVIVVLFVVVAVLLIRRQIRPAVVERLPIRDDERVLLEEEGLRVFHKTREHHGGQALTLNVRAVLTDKRILLATGGPEGRHRFFIGAIIEYTTPAPRVSSRGFAAYRQKFRLENGHPTYHVSAPDVSVTTDRGQPAFRMVVPFPEHGRFYVQPEVVIYTKQPEAYHRAVVAARNE